MPPAAEDFGSLLPGAIVHDNRMRCSGMEECRLRDPPQAENPASQDSFLSYRKLRFHTIKMLREDAHSAQG